MVASKVERAIHIGGALVTLIAGLYGGYQWGFGSGGTTVAAQGITNLERLGVDVADARQQLDDGNPVAAINSATEIIIGKNLPVVHSGLFVLEEREVVDVLPNVPMSFYLGSNMGSYIHISLNIGGDKTGLKPGESVPIKGSDCRIDYIDGERVDGRWSVQFRKAC